MSKVRVQAPVQDSSDQTATPAPEIAESTRRLAWMGLIYAGAYSVAHFGRYAIVRLTQPFEIRPLVHDTIAVVSVALGIAVFLICRRATLPASQLRSLGFAFQIAGAAGIAFNEFLPGLPSVVSTWFLGVPAECLWIIIYPLVVPTPPRNVLIASLVSASMGPAALTVAALGLGAPVPDSPLIVATYFLTSTYMCAILAFVVARIVHRYGLRLRHAREIGSYELTERLGEGGMGEVWRAHHRLLARPAAIKLIRADLLGAHDRAREAAIKRFEREAQETAVLGSTHTVDIYDFGVTQEGDFYYVMELLNGMSLERFVQLHGPMEPARVVYVLRQVCHSLGEAHARGLIHRDIKPANIFLCRLGPDDDFVKVLDFGLVKHVDGVAAGTMLTVEASTPGTPAYMAPEIALGRTGVDGRSDLYSLGCVAYFLLTGRPVFLEETAVATALAHVKDVPPPPSERSEFRIPPALDAAVLACLQKDPADRPATAAELSERLAESLHEIWTPAMARAWWDLHRAGSIAAETPTDPLAAPHVHGKGPCLRCFPKLDRTPVAH